MATNELLFTVFDGCRCGYLDFVRHVFEDCPSDINITNSLGQNCLMLCCEFNEVEIAKYLLSKRNIDYLSSDLDEHWNCLHYALRYSNFRIAQLLLNHCGSAVFPKYACDTNGCNPFDLLPPNLCKKQEYHDIYSLRNKQKQRIRIRKIYNSSFSYILQKGFCQRVYGEMICNLQVQGVLYSWGNNKNSQLGLDTNTKHRSTPKILRHLRNINIIDVSCSGYHSIAVTADGSAYSWGNNSDGRCGVGYVSNEYRPLIKRPTLLTSHSIKDVTAVACSATLDHSTLLTHCGDVYVFGCDRNSAIIKYKKKSMKLPWNNKLRPFCVTNNCNYPMRMVSSAFERSVMIGGDRVYFIGKTFNGKRKINTVSAINTTNSEVKKIGVEHACIGDNFLVLLLLNGTLLSMNRQKQKTDSDHMEFSRIRFNKQFKFKHHHNKREDVHIKGITCYNTDGSARCIAVSTNDDLYEWKAPSTDASYIGHCDGGICSISCGPRLCILCNTLGECYAFGNIDASGLSSKDKKLLNINPKDRHKMIRIVTLSQIAKVYATKECVFVIQSFLWPNRNLLNAIHHHKEMNKLKHKKMEQTFWNHDISQRKRNQNNADDDDFDRLHNMNNHNDLYDCYNAFEALSLDTVDIAAEDEKDEEKEEKKQHHKGKRSRKNSKKKHKKSAKATKIAKSTKTVKEPPKTKKTEVQSSGVSGLDEEKISSVPSLVAYCEDILIHQIDIQTVISLYTQSHRMGFHRISVFLSFVIIENIQHLMYFLLRDCSEEEVLFVEHLFKTKYYPDVHVDCAKYYGDKQYFATKKRIIEQYRILPTNYPNYKQQLSKMNITVRKIDSIEQKVQKLVLRFEKEDAQNDDDTESEVEDDDDADIIYFDSDAEQEEDIEEDKLFTQFKRTPLDRALLRLDAKERALYVSKLEILSEYNRILLKISNPEDFPSVQMMEKWKRKLRKKKANGKTYKIKNVDADKYLKHVYLKENDSQKQKQETGLSFYFDYDAYNKPKRKQHSNADIYRKFNVKDAIEKDAKKARKMDKKQEKKKKILSQKQMQSASHQTAGGAKKRRNRKRNSSSQVSTQQNQSKTIQKQRAIPSKAKVKCNRTAHSPKLQSNPTKQAFRTPSLPHAAPVSPVARKPNEPVALSPIDVVRRNREKKRLEQEISKLTNDVWDLSTKEIEDATKEQASGSLSNILNTQKKQYQQQKQKQRHQKYVQYQEMQNAWGSNQNTQRDTKPIRPTAKKQNKKVKEDRPKTQKSAVELAQIEEMQLRSLAQHEYEWMMNAPDVINNKKDDYDSFVQQQQLLLESFRHSKSEENTDITDNDYHERTRRSDYGNRGRGRGGHRDYRYNRYNDNNYNRDRGGYRGQYNNNNDYNNSYRGRGRGRGRYQYNNYHARGRGRGRGGDSSRGRGRYNYDHNQQYNDSNQWRKK